MNDQDAQSRISVTVTSTFWEMWLAALTVMRFQGVLILVLQSIFPLAGLSVLVLSFLTGRWPGIYEILLAVLCFLFTPLLQIFSVWMARRRNKLAQGLFTYAFDAEGMHTSGTTFSTTIKWAAIPRVRQSKRFFFVFVSPIAAHAIPLHALKDQGVLEAVQTIAAHHTDFK